MSVDALSHFSATEVHTSHDQITILEPPLGVLTSPQPAIVLGAVFCSLKSKTIERCYFFLLIQKLSVALLTLSQSPVTSEIWSPEGLCLV